MLGDNGLAKVADTTGAGDKYQNAIFLHPTWNGHSFMDAVRDENNWNRVMDQISGKYVTLEQLTIILQGDFVSGNKIAGDSVGGDKNEHKL